MNGYGSKSNARIDYFDKFLKFFWLRPENALLLALRAESYSSTLSYFDDSRSIDVACGDGVFSFITLGGRLSPDCDMFQSGSIKTGNRKGSFDSFDVFDDSYSIEILEKPKNKYAHGIDWKDNLIKKANKLDFYKNTFIHDNNKKIPLEDESMKYVYTNSAYWVDNFKFHLNDLVRLVEPGGIITLQIKTSDIYKLSTYNYLSFMGERFHEIIDAGRMSTWKGLQSKNDIADLIKSNNNLEISRFEPIYGGCLAKVWDIGLRPLFNPLVKMANNLDDNSRSDIKKEWCTIIYDLFLEYLISYQPENESAIEYLIVLEKK